MDVPIGVPEVPVFPVLKAQWMDELPDAFLDEYNGNATKETGIRWYATKDTYGIASANHDWDLLITREEANKKNIKWPTEVLPLTDVDWNSAYAYNNSFTIGEAYSFMEQILSQCFTKYGEVYNKPALKYISLEYPPSRNDVYLREKGAFFFHCYETLRGIPILDSIGKGCNDFTPTYDFHIISPDSYCFYSQLYKETEMLNDDVPLLPFSEIQPVFESLIQKGLLRDVYEVSLGYLAIYEEGKGNNETYRLIPCWMLVGEYYNSSKTEGKEWEIEVEPDYMRWTTTQKILINAQTGKVIDQNASNKENKKLFSVKTR